MNQYFLFFQKVQNSLRIVSSDHLSASKTIKDPNYDNGGGSQNLEQFQKL